MIARVWAWLTVSLHVPAQRAFLVRHALRATSSPPYPSPPRASFRIATYTIFCQGQGAPQDDLSPTSTQPAGAPEDGADESKMVPRHSADHQPGHGHEQVAPRRDSRDGASSEEIVPLKHFSWLQTPPHVFHPFHAPYHLKMGLQVIPLSELITMDSTYLQNITQRKSIMRDHADKVLGALPRADASVEELYSLFTATYLPQRYPTMFELCNTDAASSSCPTHIRNLVDGELYPLQPSDSAIRNLEALGSLMDEDLHIMMPPDNDQDKGYVLAAFLNCFANGASTSRRLGKSVQDIHKPVPAFSAKLGDRLDKWFATFETGKVVLRSNWTITDDNRMFVPEGHQPFSHAADDTPNITIDQLYIRSERQTLQRLAHSRAVIFSVKTYFYPVSLVKENGYGPDLARAIKGLDQGNAPGMGQYKKSEAWEEAVTAYLLS